MKNIVSTILLVLLVLIVAVLSKCSTEELNTFYTFVKGPSIKEVPIEDSPLQAFKGKVFCTSRELLYARWRESNSYTFDIQEYEFTDDIELFREKRQLLKKIPAKSILTVKRLYKGHSPMHGTRDIIVVEIMLKNESLWGTFDFLNKKFKNKKMIYSLNEKFLLSDDECNK